MAVAPDGETMPTTKKKRKRKPKPPPPPPSPYAEMDYCEQSACLCLHVCAVYGGTLLESRGVGPRSQTSNQRPHHPFIPHRLTVVAGLPTPTYPNFGFDVLAVRVFSRWCGD